MIKQWNKQNNYLEEKKKHFSEKTGLEKIVPLKIKNISIIIVIRPINSVAHS